MQGIIDFATLLEQADPKSRETIILQARSQDEEFVYHVMKRVVYFDELVYLDEAVLAEILSKVSPKVLAFAIREKTPEFREKLLRNLSHRDRKVFADEEEKMNETYNTRFALGAQKQILKVARNLEAQNKFVFEALESPRFKRGTKDKKK